MSTDTPQTTPSPAPSAPQAAAIPKKERPTLRSALMAVAIAGVGILLVLRAWNVGPFQTADISTDNAYVRGQVTVLAPQVNGYVTDVLVRDFEHVRAGQPLVQIDRRSYEAALAQAQAQLANARAQLANSAQAQSQNRATLQAKRATLRATQAETERAQAELQRMQTLAAQGAVALNDRDRVRATAHLAQSNTDKAQADIAITEEAIKATEVNRDALEAAVQMAQAQVRQAEIHLENTTVRAPADGQISEASVRQGQYVSAGSQLLYVVPPTLWVVANFKETQTAQVRIGQRAYFTVDALDDAELTGTVNEIAPATGSEFAVLKGDNATGNFTKVVQRLPIKIVIDSDQVLSQRLRPGMSVIAHIDTASTVQPAASAPATQDNV